MNTKWKYATSRRAHVWWWWQSRLGLKCTLDVQLNCCKLNAYTHTHTQRNSALLSSINVPSITAVWQFLCEKLLNVPKAMITWKERVRRTLKLGCMVIFMMHADASVATGVRPVCLPYVTRKYECNFIPLLTTVCMSVYEGTWEVLLALRSYTCAHG